MRKQHLLILSIVVFSSIARFALLGQIPEGISVSEVKFGLSLSFLGNWILNPLLIRLPFAILGIASIYVFYKMVLKIFENKKTALISAGLLAVTPWHIQETRILSLGMLLFFITTLFVYIFSEKILQNIDKFFKYSIFFSVFIFFISIAVSLKTSSPQVNIERSVVANSAPAIVSKIFINKYLESTHQKYELIFENLDFGNLFFNGHPRQRWGMEDVQKLTMFFLPLMLIGILKIETKYKKFIFSWLLVSIATLSFFKFRQSETLVLLPPFIFLAAVGINKFLEEKPKTTKILFVSIIALGIYELISFGVLYYSGVGESLFSPRRTIYEKLVNNVSSFQKPNEQVVVNTNLGDPKPFFDFYLKRQIENYEFKNYVFWQESTDNKLFVDTLPDDPSPSEPLYKTNGNWPNSIEVLDGYYDKGRRQTVVVYRVK